MKKIHLNLLIICVSIALISCNVKNDAISDTKIATIAEIGNHTISNEKEVVIPETQKKTKTPSSKIEYDVYKKINLSEFIKKDNVSFIDHINGGILLSDKPCKVTIKANIKFEKGPALPDEDISDALATGISIGPVSSEIYYADYENDYFGSFHEIERAQEFFSGVSGKGKIWFSDLGITILKGSPGFSESYVSNNGEEFVGEFLDQDGKELKIRVIIKDIYYKISRPTGSVTDWDLNKDFSITEFYDKKSFVMKELDTNYNYIIRPKYTFTINDNYKKTQIKYISFYYTDNTNIPELCKRIMNDRESNVIPHYSKIGIGFGRGDFKKNDGTISEVDISWDKTTKTITATDDEGEIAATIKIDYIKEYKYKKPIENETPGYKKYLMTVENENIEYNESINLQKKTEELEKNKVLLSGHHEQEDNDYKINVTGHEDLSLTYGEHTAKCQVPICECKMIPEIGNVVKTAVSASFKSFFDVFYNMVDKDMCNLGTHSNFLKENNYFKIIINGSGVFIEVYVDLSTLQYSYSGYWSYRDGYIQNGSGSGVINRTVPKDTTFNRPVILSKHIFKWISLGYEPRITDWIIKYPRDIKEIEDAEIGDNIKFGKNSSGILYWQVIDKKDDRLLIITKQIVDGMEYKSDRDISWESSYIREWLNNDFYKSSFDYYDKKRIIEDAEKVFLLSYDEANMYFKDNKSRQCQVSAHARKNKVWFSSAPETHGNGDYWLRTNGISVDGNGNSKMYVNQRGIINNVGETNTLKGIRPAVWIYINGENENNE